MSCMKLWSHKVGIESKTEELTNINKEIDERGRQIVSGTSTYKEDKSYLEAQVGDVVAKQIPKGESTRHEVPLTSQKV